MWDPGRAFLVPFSDVQGAPGWQGTLSKRSGAKPPTSLTRSPALAGPLTFENRPPKSQSLPYNKNLTRRTLQIDRARLAVESGRECGALDFSGRFSKVRRAPGPWKHGSKKARPWRVTKTRPQDHSRSIGLVLLHSLAGNLWGPDRDCVEPCFRGQGGPRGHGPLSKRSARPRAPPGFRKDGPHEDRPWRTKTT